MPLRFLLIGCFLLLVSPLKAYYDYQLELLSPNTHTFLVQLDVEASTEAFTDFQLATWRPGRYYLQDYAAALSHFSATRPDGTALRWQKVSPSTWRVFAVGGKIRLHYRYFADNQDAGSSYYTDDQLYFNPVNCFLYVPGQLDRPVSLTLPLLPNHWSIATALLSNEEGVLLADTWHEFADSPTVCAARMKHLSFQTEGVQFYLHFQGDYQGDAATDSAAIATVAQISQEQAAIFGGFPFEEYHFIYRLLPFEMRHAVEHSRSSSYALPAQVSASADQIISGIGGITSHEFWHAWNVKRIRPAALFPYDYSQPQYSSLHWFTEGVTDYYTSLILARSGVQSREYLYRQLARTIQSLENNYATSVVSPSQSSYDSWLAPSPYRHPDHGISYYTLGSRLGLALDLTLRAQSKGKKSLDDVFQYLFQQYYKQNRGVPEDGIQQAVEAVSGKDWGDWFAQYVHGTAAFEYPALFAPLGLELVAKTAKNTGSKQLGILNLESRAEGLLVRRLHPGGDAFQDGLANGDLIVGLDGQVTDLPSFNERINGLAVGQSVSVLVKRENLPLQEIVVRYQERYTAQSFTLQQKPQLSGKEEKLLESWLETKQK